MRILRQGPANDFRHACIDDCVFAEIERVKRNPVMRNGVVIGTLAVNFYAKPRYANEIEILFSDKRRNQRLGDVPIGVELRPLTPDAIGLPDAIVAKAFATATMRDGLMVASREGLIALKLFGATQSARRFYQETADVVSLLVDHDVDLTGWGLVPTHLQVLENTVLGRGHRPTQPRIGKRHDRP